jgi:hypothetical protein
MDETSPTRHLMTWPEYRFGDVQLEMSLKPYFDTSEATARRVAAELFTQWLPLCRHAETVSVMLWMGDGSEILEYGGDLDAEFEWGRYHGSANANVVHPARKPADGNRDEAGIGVYHDASDPEGLGLHRRPYLYREDPARFTFRWLRSTIALLKEVGGQVTGKRVLVGETFDTGPEFSVSRFKYAWHPEICGGGQSWGGKFLRCEARLEADDRPYATFPKGIPAGTPFGRFLGRQARRFLDDLGFDFLWLSNGVGFGLEPWSLTGGLFDGLRFHPDRATATRDRILEFWTELRTELGPATRLRTRGTNLTTGVDLSTDAAPLREVYAEDMGADAPVNSPWAALDADFGLEFAGWMSHVARRPGRGYRFRFYTHDPWWMNSPWLDRYGRQPHDLYLPLSICRLRRDGSAEPPRDLAFLTVDDSLGEMPPKVPAEVVPHLLRAREFVPDAPAPLVWVYPFDDYHRKVFEAPQALEEVFFGDWFVRGMINQGLPLNTVADAAEFLDLAASHPERLLGSVLVTPVPDPGSGLERALLAHAKRGGSALLYGPLPEGSRALARALNLRREPAALEGDFEVHLPFFPRGEEDPGTARHIRHTALFSGGGMAEVLHRDDDPDTQVLALALQHGAGRVASLVRRQPSGGLLAWVRGSLTSSEFDPADPRPVRGPLLRPFPEARFFPAERLARFALARLGWELCAAAEGPDQRRPYLCLHRHLNAVVFSGYHPDETARLRVRLPCGAPALEGCHNVLREGRTEISGRIAWHHECRVLVEGQDSGTVHCRYAPVVMHGVRRRLLVSGLRGARVRFLPEPGSEPRLRILRDPVFPYFVGDFVEPRVEPSPLGPCATVERADGTLLFQW